MTTGHLNDGQIQEILDSMVFEPGQSLAPHLETCASCRERFEQYRRLYAGLAADPGFALPQAFADSTIKKLPVAGPIFWARPAVRVFLAVSACALVLGGLFIFVDMKPLADEVIRFFNTMAAAFQPLPTQFQQLLAKLNVNVRLFVLGGLALLCAALFDHILQRQTIRRSR
jgi:hypothetical protein